MRIPFITVAKYLILISALLLLNSCKKAHLEPVSPPAGNPEPLVYISAKLDNDSVYFAGGVNNYIGTTFVYDTLNDRTFNFTLGNPNTPSQSNFKISINNYRSVLGNPQNDLDSSIYPGSRLYEGGVFGFTPLSASVSWVNDAGITFRSTTTGPNLFSITSVEDIVFELKKYKKTTLQFECFLGYSNISIHLTNGKATVLFSVN